MGGFGSGRPGSRAKTEQMKRLDLVRLRRKGYLSGFPVRISWSYGGRAALVASACKPAVRRSSGCSTAAATDDGEWYDVDEAHPDRVDANSASAGAANGSAASNAAGDAASSTEAAGFGAGAAIASATAHKPRRVPIAPPAPCSRSFGASIPKRIAMTCRPSPRACTGAPTIASSTVMSKQKWQSSTLISAGSTESGCGRHFPLPSLSSFAAGIDV